jgi:hypothetical protein
LDFIIEVADAPSPVVPAARLPPPPPVPFPTPLARRAVRKASVVNMNSMTYAPTSKNKNIPAHTSDIPPPSIYQRQSEKTIKLKKKIPEHTRDIPPPSIKKRQQKNKNKNNTRTYERHSAAIHVCLADLCRCVRMGLAQLTTTN